MKNNKKSYIPVNMNQKRCTAITHRNSVARKREEDLLTGTYHIALLLSVMALRDEFEFGTKRIEAFLDKVQFYLNQYNDGYVSVKDMVETIKEETGITMMDLDKLKDEDYVYREDR